MPAAPTRPLRRIQRVARLRRWAVLAGIAVPVLLTAAAAAAVPRSSQRLRAPLPRGVLSVAGSSFPSIRSVLHGAVGAVLAHGRAAGSAAGSGDHRNATLGAAPSAAAPANAPVAAGAAAAGSGGAVRGGDSKTACIYVTYANFSFQGALTAAEQSTRVTFPCLETFVNGTATWSQWSSPWVDNPSYGFTSWQAADPSGRTVVLSMDLVPTSVDEPNGAPDPAAWEPACAAGAFDPYAASLASNLVAAGFANAVIRLGFEMNGSWEPDFMGTTATEQQQWAQCFGQEVQAMWSVPGARFLFDWDPNACVEDVPLARFYPGNASVDIVGVDAYDAFCNGSQPHPSPATFQALAAEPGGLDALTAFAARQGKPMSLPEWGTVAASSGGGLGDDAFYVEGIGRWVATNDVAFQSYFDVGRDGILPLSTADPATLHAYAAAFG